MGNWHDPALISRDFCALPIVALTRCRPDKQPTSRYYKAASRPRQSLHVRSPYLQKRPTLILIYTLSWETVFTAGFELNVFRGKQPYRWTIWVGCCSP